jgi:hypothetical protein
MQQRLERIYEVQAGLDVHDFLVTDQAFASYMDQCHGLRQSQEKLLVSQNGNQLDVSLYIQRELIDQLDGDDPMSNLHEGNISAYLIALEGVSHLLYLAWNARYEREISLFELELQAEVDKYIFTMILLANQEDYQLPTGLLNRLFLQHTYASDMNMEEQNRYERANYYAYHYCKALQHNCIDNQRMSLFNDLRRFYRLTSHHKINHITTALH